MYSRSPTTKPPKEFKRSWKRRGVTSTDTLYIDVQLDSKNETQISRSITSELICNFLGKILGVAIHTLHFQASRNRPHKTRSPTKALSTARCWQWHSTSVKSRDHSLGCWPEPWSTSFSQTDVSSVALACGPSKNECIWISLYLPNYKPSPNGQQITDFVWFCDLVDKTPCLNHFSQKTKPGVPQSLKLTLQKSAR